MCLFICFFFLFFFFFSSRRRHTRSLCDWSSDVCSSDLQGEKPLLARLECLGGSRKAHRHRRRHCHRRRCFYSSSRLAERDPRRSVEGNRHRRQLACVGDRKRTYALGDVCHRAERNEVTLLRAHVQHPQRIDVLLELWQKFHYHHVLIVRRVDRRHLSRPVCVVKRALDLLRGNAQGGGAIAVDCHPYFGISDLEITRNILDLPDVPHSRFQPFCRRVQHADVGSLE